MLGRAELHQQLVAREALALQRLQPLDVAAQPLAPHAALLVDARVALRQHVHVLLGGQPLDLHALAHLAPRACSRKACSSFVSRPLGVPTR